MTSVSVSLLLLSCNDIPHLTAALRAEFTYLQDDYSLLKQYRYLGHLQMFFRSYVITLANIKKFIKGLFLQAFINCLSIINGSSFVLVKKGGA